MSKSNDDILWRGRPWVVPQIVGATIVMAALGIFIIWLESILGYASTPILGVWLAYWTVLVLAIVWFLWVLKYLLQRATEKYTLRKIGLEVERGIISKRNIVLSTGGFSDMQVIRSLIGRVLSVGDIVIRSEGEHDIRLKKIRRPVETMGQIREVMSRPIVRFTDEPKSEQRK